MKILFNEYTDILEGWADIDSDSLDDEESKDTRSIGVKRRELHHTLAGNLFTNIKDGERWSESAVNNIFVSFKKASTRSPNGRYLRIYTYFNNSQQLKIVQVNETQGWDADNEILTTTEQIYIIDITKTIDEISQFTKTKLQHYIDNHT